MQPTRKALSWASAAAMLFATCAGASTIYTPIAFQGTNNINTALIVSAPTGTITPSNSFGAPFSIPASGNNFFETSTGPLSITGLSINSPTEIFTLLNAYAPTPGANLGTLTFRFTGGSSLAFDLIGGSNVRDFYQGAFANTLTSPSAQNAYSFTNVKGGGATGDVNTGLTGNYVIDEQSFYIAPLAAGLTLEEIDLVRNGNGVDGFPILLALTVAQDRQPTGPSPAPTPEPASLALTGLSLSALAGLLRRRNRRGATL